MDGMNQHKRMAGAGDSGNFGVQGYSKHHGAAVGNPDRAADTGSKGHMPDSDRGIASPHISRGRGMHPAQRAPDHGPHNVMWDRGAPPSTGGKV